MDRRLHSTPEELLSDKWIRPPVKYNEQGKPVGLADGKEFVSIDVNASEFMSADGSGRFALGTKFDVVKEFFKAENDNFMTIALIP